MQILSHAALQFFVHPVVLNRLWRNKLHVFVRIFDALAFKKRRHASPCKLSNSLLLPRAFQ